MLLSLGLIPRYVSWLMLKLNKCRRRDCLVETCGCWINYSRLGTCNDDFVEVQEAWLCDLYFNPLRKVHSRCLRRQDLLLVPKVSSPEIHH